MAEHNHTGHEGLAGSAASGSHSSVELNSAGLNAALQAFMGADRAFFADLNELNNSEAEGGALLLLKGDQLTVITAARGVEAGQVHVQHIHGFEDGRDAKVPTLAQDDDRDGFVELAEGLDTYGPILLNLTSSPEAGLSGFPNPTGTSFLFSQSYDLSDPSNGELAKLLDDVSLSRREIVLHGTSVLEGHGLGTAGEVDGSAGYKLVLPIASGEIRELSYKNALASFEAALSVKLRAAVVGDGGNDVLRGTGADDNLSGGGGRDSLSGRAGDDYLNGGSGRDVLYGGSGDDYLDGGRDNDRLFGNSGKDHLFGGSGSDELTGGSGHDHLYGGSGNDRAFFNVSTDGSDTVNLGAGSDSVSVSAATARQIRLTFTSAEVGNGTGNGREHPDQPGWRDWPSAFNPRTPPVISLVRSAASMMRASPSLPRGRASPSTCATSSRGLPVVISSRWSASARKPPTLSPPYDQTMPITSMPGWATIVSPEGGTTTFWWAVQATTPWMGVVATTSSSLERGTMY